MGSSGADVFVKNEVNKNEMILPLDRFVAICTAVDSRGHSFHFKFHRATGTTYVMSARSPASSGRQAVLAEARKFGDDMKE